MSKYCRTEMRLGPRSFKLDWPEAEGAHPEVSWSINPNGGTEDVHMIVRGTVGFEPPSGTKRFYRMDWLPGEAEGRFAWLAPGEGIQGGNQKLLKELKADAAIGQASVTATET